MGGARWGTNGVADESVAGVERVVGGTANGIVSCRTNASAAIGSGARGFITGRVRAGRRADVGGLGSGPRGEKGVAARVLTSGGVGAVRAGLRMKGVGA